MFRRSFTLVVLVFLLIPAAVFPVETAEEVEPGAYSVESVRDSLVQRFQHIQDFMVQVVVRVQTPWLRMPRKIIDLAYKQPDQIRVDSEGFAVAPRTGLIMAPGDMMDNMQEIGEITTGQKDGEEYILLTGTMHQDSLHTPMDMRSGENAVISTTLRIDPRRWVITGMETRMDTARVLSIDVTYTSPIPRIWVPEETTMTFFLPREMDFPESGEMPDGMGEGIPAPQMESEKSRQGSIHMTFRGYRVNTGLEDAFFEQSDNR